MTSGVVITNRDRLELVFRTAGPRDAGAVLRIGVISDTHGLLRPEVKIPLAGVAHIVHAGDIGSPNVIAGLQRIAPVIAIRGNVDTGHWAEQYPTNDVVCMADVRRADQT
jgi:predicted phosphodiesterase